MRQHGYSKRRTWRKVRLGLDANTTQVRAVLMTHQDVADGDVLAEPPGQIPDDELLDVIGGEGACDTKPCNAAIAARSTTPPIPPREGTAYWPARRSIAKCNRAHTPAACQSRGRRQHVIPLPKPSSCGKSSHGIPVCRTYRMPFSAGRSSTARRRPPLGDGVKTGISGSAPPITHC